VNRIEITTKGWYRPAGYRGRRLLFGLLVALCLPGTAGAAAMKVAFLAPDPAGASPHWDRAVELMQAAAEDLQIDLEVVYSKTNTYTNRKRGLALLTDDEKPDYFVTGYWSGATETLLKHAERLGVRSFVVTSGVVPDDRKTVGTPRGKYRQWLGQMTPDDRQGGYQLGERLIERARQTGVDETVHVVGLGGYGDAAVELERREGLEQSVADGDDVVLDDFMFAEWSQATAYRSLKKVLGRDAPVSVVWSASDNMALGAVQAVRDAGKQPGKDVFIGGFNWSVEGIEAVQAGEMEATLGGHFLQGAWALVLLYDYHHEHDFADDLGVEFQTPLKAVTRTNADDYRAIISDADWSAVDFKQFSKVHNPDLKTYRWPLDEILEQLQ
jgi:ABC-type sugar transport system substrate-binding protein